MVKRVYYFSANGSDADKTYRNLLGGKGANLAEMCNMGLPVPPGYTITTTTCMDYQAEKKLPEGTLEEMWVQLAKLEKEMGQTFGGSTNPLLLSIRSGARASMPGMMDTILDSATAIFIVLLNRAQPCFWRLTAARAYPRVASHLPTPRGKDLLQVLLRHALQAAQDRRLHRLAVALRPGTTDADPH